MDVEEFKQKYEKLKDNPMYKNFCSILDTKNQVLERTAKKNQELKKQLGYLHSGEYLNQLRFERNMLQDVVDKMEVSKEDKMFIDMTRRNTELLEENRELNRELDATKELVAEHIKKEIDLKEINKDISKGLQKVSIKRNKWKKRYYTERRKSQELHEQLSNSHQIKAQQKEFIEYLNKYIKERRRLSKLHKEYSLSEERLSAQCHVLENVLLKYKEIIGYSE